ncbi:hypothetical protein RKD49_007748 [Streptomyces glaucescens]|jgi:hypothetical protein
MYDCFGDVDRVPELLERVEREDDAKAWDELGYRLVLDGLSGTGRWMHETAVRDGQDALADGITYLYGRAERPRCAGVFTIADEYASSNRPVM